MDAETPSPNNRKPWLRWVVLALLVIAGAGVGARYAWRAHHFESTDDAFVDGSVVRVAPQVPGRVAAVAVVSDERVEAGALLVSLDATDLEIALARARAARAEAAGRMSQAQAQANVAAAALDQAHAAAVVAAVEASNAARDLSRYRQVSTGAVSRQSLDAVETAAKRTAAETSLAESRERAARAQVTLAASQLETSTAEVESAGVVVRQAEQQLSYAAVRAPKSGRVTMKNVEVGDFVQVGQALMALVADDVWVVANFKETQLTEMQPGEPVDIEVDAFPDRALRGHVQSIQAGAASRFSLMPPENATGNFVKVVQRVPVRIRFDEPPEKLVGLAPGLSVVPRVKVR